MKLAHLSDLHLGFRQYERLTPRGSNQREADVATALKRAVDDLLEQKPDCIVIAGDVFNAVRPTNAAILTLFQELQRIRQALPETAVIIVAGNHDTPRSVETWSILRLYEALGVQVALDVPRRIPLPAHDAVVLAVPHQAIAQAERPALRPEPGVAHNILVVHAEVDGIFAFEKGAAEYGSGVLTRAELGAAHWDYVALGAYHVARELESNMWYSGSLDYVSHNPWGELIDEKKHKRPGKGYLLVDLPGAKVTFRPIEAPRRFVDLPPIDAPDQTAAELDAEIAAAIKKVKPSVDDQVIRLVVRDISRGVAKDLNHEAIRAVKARALNFHLDLRRPPTPERAASLATPGRKPLTLPETVKDFLSRRPLDADLDREEFVRVGVEYVEKAGAGTREEGIS
ncbi:MAG TPA: DNA repair exonuclease [Gemmatimonadales bacterium]|nr:DNA repair exonuclease [Gemmatimonadales bacterium]